MHRKRYTNRSQIQLRIKNEPKPEKVKKSFVNYFRNLKMIASVIYYSAINYLINKVPLKHKINSKEDVIQSQLNRTEKQFIRNYDNDNNSVHKSLIVGTKRVESKRNQKQDYDLIINKMIEDVSLFFSKDSPDSNCNEIEFIQNNLLKNNQLSGYYYMCKEFKFDFTAYFDQWVNKLFDICKIV